MIEVSELRKRYRNATAVNGLSFRIADGRITGFLGPNGAGKTTTLRILLGLVQATSGRATIDGRIYRDLADPIRRVGAVTSLYRGFADGTDARVAEINARFADAIYEVVRYDRGTLASLAELTAELLELVRPAATRLGGAEYLDALDGEASEADLQIAVGKSAGLRAAAADVAERTVVSD